MKFEERINIPCTKEFKERVKKAAAKEAQGTPEMPNLAAIGSRLLAAYADSRLLPATHPRNQK